MAVKPLVLVKKKQTLEDIALITVAQVISSEVVTSLENVTLTTFGSTRRVVSSKDVTTIIEGYGSKTAIDDRLSYLKINRQFVRLNMKKIGWRSE
ncbi:MAG: hypothetical protein ACTS45_01680 [Candidatus Hodgkinia cicadicola]